MSASIARWMSLRPWVFTALGAAVTAGTLVSCGTTVPVLAGAPARTAASGSCPPPASLVPGQPGSQIVSGGLSGVAAVRDGSAWAVGTTIMTDPMTMRWNGSVWSEDVLTIAEGQPGNPPGGFDAVAAVSADDVWAIGGTAGQPLAEHWDGRSWTVVRTPSPGPTGSGANLYGAAAVTTRDIWAVGGTNGGQTWVMHWDGTSWSRMPSPNPADGSGAQLTAVAAASADNAWAVGSYSGDSPTAQGRPLIEHWDGKTWTVVPSTAIPGAAFPVLTGVAIASPDSAWAVGYGGLIEHWDGKTWTKTSSPGLAGRGNLDGVAALSPDNAWAVGSGGLCPGGLATIVEHWDGKTWTVVPSPATGVLTSVTAISPDSAWAVGSSSAGGGGTAVIEHWDGKTWTLARPPSSCTSSSSSDCLPPSTSPPSP